MAATGMVKPVAVGKVYIAVLTDGAAAHTYSTLVELPGVQEFTVDPQFYEAILEVELKRDEVFAKLQGANGTIKCGYFDLTALQTALNQDAVSAVTGPPAGKALHLDANNMPVSVGIFFKPVGTGDTGDKDLHILVAKAKLKLGPMSFNREFAGTTFNYTGVARTHDDRVIGLVSLDTSTAVTATTADA